MKKRFLGIAAVAALTFTMASCGEKKTTNKMQNNPIENVNTVISTHIDAITVAQDKDNEIGLKASEYKMYDDDKYDYYQGVSSDLLLLKNTKGYVGIYSYLEGKFLVSPIYKTELLNNVTIEKTLNNLNSSIIRINYAGQYTYIDSFGNTIVKDSNYTYNFENPTLKENAYYVRFYSNAAKVEKYLEYKIKDNGKATVVAQKPLSKNERDYNKGDLFNSVSYTLKTTENTYYLGFVNVGQNKYIQVYDKDYKVVKKIEVPFGANNLNVAYFQNGNALVQYSVALALDETKYDYSDGISKYDLTTLKFNLADESKPTEVDLPYVFSNATPIYEANEKIAYNQVLLKEIVENKTLASSKYYLLKDDYELANDLGFNISNLSKTGNGYLYNVDTNDVLYDTNLNVITQMNYNANDCYVKDLDAFVFARNGYYGVVASDGKVTVPFEYESINTTSQVNGKVYASNKFGKIGILDTKTGTFTELNKFTLSSIGIYTKYDSEAKKTTFMNLSGEVTKDGNFMLALAGSNFFGSKAIFYRTDSTDENQEYYTMTVNDCYFNTIGTELTDDYTINNEKDNATTLNVGDNANVTIVRAGSYFKLDVEADSKLVIKTYASLYTTIVVYNADPFEYVSEAILEKTEKIDDNERTLYTYTLDVTAGSYYVTILGNSSYITNVNVAFETETEE